MEIYTFFAAKGKTYTKCPAAPKKDGKLQSIYMFTHNSPCTPKMGKPIKDEGSCTSRIATFAKECKKYFKNLYIGYVNEYTDAKLAEERIKAIENAAIKRIEVKEKNILFGSNECCRIF